MMRDFSLHLFLIIGVFIIGCMLSSVAEVKRKKIDLVVAVFHFILPQWEEPLESYQPPRRNNYNCDKHIKCRWFTSHDLSILNTNLTDLTIKLEEDMTSPPLLTLSMYNIHSLSEKYRVLHPLPCFISTNISLYSTQESTFRYREEFRVAQHNFDAYSSTHPQSNIQRVYESAILWEEGLLPLHNFSSLIKGGAYVASDCHKKDGANSHRDLIASQLREFGVRIDGLGKCLHTKNIPEGVSLPKTKDRNLQIKRQAINRYAFTLAFENSIEDGYVTEKVFDALMAGTVPIYLGDSAHLKTLLPHPKAVIFVDDFSSLQELSVYIKSLLHNETAYEIHREWRTSFDEDAYRKGKPLLEKSWNCHVCEWAAKQYNTFLHINSINSNSSYSQYLREGSKRSSGFERNYRIGNRRCNQGPPPLLLKPKEKKKESFWSYFLRFFSAMF